MRRLLPLVLAASLLAAGCAQQTRSDSLTATLGAYGSAVRWSGLQNGLQFVDPKVLKANPPSDIDLDRFKQVRVTDYDDGGGPVALSDTEVQQTVQIRFVNVHTQVERSVTEHQVWRYDDKAKHWWLESGLPDIRQE